MKQRIALNVLSPNSTSQIVLFFDRFFSRSGRPVPKGTADMISPLPSVIETPLGHGKWECVRHLPQIMVRGEHVVLVNIIDQ